MKKYLGIILSALMAISFLQGCSDDDNVFSVGGYGTVFHYPNP